MSLLGAARGVRQHEAAVEGGVGDAVPDDPLELVGKTPLGSLSAQAGQTVPFAGTGTDPDGTVTAWSWTFPGGTPAASSAEDPGAVREINRGFYGKANVGGSGYLGTFSPVASAGTYVAESTVVRVARGEP